jgi:serine/threonine-protein kinase
MTEHSHTVADGSANSATSEAYCPECGQSFPPEVERCPDDRAALIRLRDKIDPLIGRVFEQRYEIRSQLGEGGMGTVYRGWQLSFDREVAIKVIDPKLSSNRDVVKRFLREARLSSRLGQPSIVNVFDFGQTEDGILYIVMELLRGRTLAKELEARRVFSVERALHIAMQLCDALDAAHKLRIIHRDLKPSNVVILDEPPGRDLVKVLDFGLAKSLGSDALSKVTRSDAVLGTPQYMSPEQIQGHPSDHRADLYSLGCMLHEMLSGTTPFGGNTIDRVLSNHMYELAAPLPPDLPVPLADLITRLIAKHPDERPDAAADVREALAAQIGQTTALRSRTSSHAAGAAFASTTSAPPVRAAERRRWLIGLAALVAFGVLATALAFGLRDERGAQPAAAPSRTPPVGSAVPAIEPSLATTFDAGSPVVVPDDAEPRPPEDARSPQRDAARITGRPAARPAARPKVDAGDDLEFYVIDAGR